MQIMAFTQHLNKDVFILETQLGKQTFMGIYNFWEIITRVSYALLDKILMHCYHTNNIAGALA